jgi:hypothetical protein
LLFDGADAELFVEVIHVEARTDDPSLTRGRSCCVSRWSGHETHFRCYTISNQTPEPANLVTLDDLFLPPTMLSVDEPELFCPPTSKNRLEIEEPEEHLTTYGAPSPLEPDLGVRTEDQFGLRTLRMIGARELFVPTQKLVGDLGFPDRLNHYWRYEASGPKVGQTVTFDDQFGSDTVRVERPHPVLQQKRMPPEGTEEGSPPARRRRRNARGGDPPRRSPTRPERRASPGRSRPGRTGSRGDCSRRSPRAREPDERDERKEDAVRDRRGKR